MKQNQSIALLTLLAAVSIVPPALEGEAAVAQTPPSTDSPSTDSIDLAPEIIEQSPVLQRWQEEIPDVRQDIRNDPSFRTRIRVGYGEISGEGSVSVGVEDVFLGRSNFTISGDYQGGDRSSYGADLHYYVRPLGSTVNIAPVVGYRRLDETDGVNLGARLMLSLSRTGAADISVTQSWVAPGSSEEAGLTRVVFGYAVSDRLRLSTDYQRQNTPEFKDDRWGIALEWLL